MAVREARCDRCCRSKRRSRPRQAVRKTLQQGASAAGSKSWSVPAARSSARWPVRCCLRLGDREQLPSLRELAQSGNAEVRRLLVDQLRSEIERLPVCCGMRLCGCACRRAEAGGSRRSASNSALREALAQATPEALSALSGLRRRAKLPPCPRDRR